MKEECAFLKGSAKSMDHNFLAHGFWYKAARLNCAVRMERAPSDDNIADLPSRGDHDVLAEEGFKWVKPRVLSGITNLKEWAGTDVVDAICEDKCKHVLVMCMACAVWHCALPCRGGAWYQQAN